MLYDRPYMRQPFTGDKPKLPPIVMNLIHEDTAADTSEITYKLRFGMVGNTSGTAYLGSGHHSIERFGNTAGVQIHITEYDA